MHIRQEGDPTQKQNHFLGQGVCKVAREVVGAARDPIVIIVEVIQCKVD
jgi:hypothetical protein